MAASIESSENGCKNFTFKCFKCNKKVINGVQCVCCESSFHIKCGKAENLDYWSCPSCSDVSKPASLLEIKLQLTERENLLLIGENAAYKHMHQQMEEKYLLIQQELVELRRCISHYIPNPSKVTNRKPNETLEAPVQPDKTEVLPKIPVVVPPETSTTVSKNDAINNTSININATDGPKEKTKLMDKDGFKLVQRKTRARTKTTVGENSDKSLSAVPKCGYLHVYRLEKSTTCDAVMSFLEKRKPNVNFSCEKLESRGDYASFKVKYPMLIYDEINNKAFWPEGVAFRRFFLGQHKSSS